jgi:nitrogenase subunit NifH/nitrogenase molybdenum-iron protein alpha/beta subunit
VPKGEERLEEVLRPGYLGIGCVEAGGPKPGVGCAGRGIITAFEFLERHRAKEAYDAVLYDVLGDVVCGGFAVPIRREYANAVFLVTSGEFMALYAANNILRGIRSFDGSDCRRAAGIIFNQRRLEGETERVERFAAAVGLPIVARVPRSEGFSLAEEQRVPLMALEGFVEEKTVFTQLAEQIRRGLTLYEARPLEDEALEDVVLRGGTGAVPHKPVPVQEPAEEAPKPVPVPAHGGSRMPLYGCAFNGAATTAVHLTDGVIIAHSPRSCAFYTWQNISSPGRRNLFNRGILMPSAISPSFETTEMGHAEAVFGGLEKLKAQVERALERKPGAVVVISSCVSGIIGDDIAALERLSTPETPVIAVNADGVLGGDYMEGIRLCLHRLAERLVRRDAPVKPRTVNLIGEVGVSNYTESDYRTLRRLLGDMGITIGCRFLGDCTAEELRGLLSAPLNLLATDSQDNLELKEWLEGEYGCRFHPGTLPIGFRATRDFLLALGDFFGCRSEAEALIAREEADYRREIEALRPLLQGKRVLMTTINANLDWLLDAAEDCGMEFVWIGVLNYLHRELRVTDRAERFSRIQEIAGGDTVERRIRELRPDMVLGNYTARLTEGDYLTDTLPMTQPIGFGSGLAVLRRWAQLNKNTREGEWQNDEAWFQTYFA